MGILFSVLLILPLAVPCLALSRDDPEVDSKSVVLSRKYILKPSEYDLKFSAYGYLRTHKALLVLLVEA